MAFTTIGIVWLLTLVNILGARETGWVQVVTTVLKFVPLAVIGIIGLFYMHAANFTSFAPAGLGTGKGMIGGITAAAALTLWAFIGLESATVPAEEVRNPKKTIPRATVLGTGVTTLVYILATVAIMGILPLHALADSASPFAAAAASIFGGTWGKVIAAVALISTFGCLNGWILIQGRVPFAAARNGLFPRQFAKLHGRRGTPVFGLVVSSVLITGLVMMNYTRSLVDQFTFVILLATLTDPRPVRLLGGGRGVPVHHRSRSLRHAPLRRRDGDRHPGLRLLGVGDHRRRHGRDREGIPAPADRDPGLRLRAVA